MSNHSVNPLRARTMTLSELQLRALNLIRLCKFQLRRSPYDAGGMSDEEFIENELEPLETEIFQDRQVSKMARNAGKRGPKTP